MSTPHDPTNANAVPGSSKHPYNPGDIPGVNPPAPPALARIDPSGSAPPTEPNPVAKSSSVPPPRRRADGPIIVPTVVGADGVREVPSLFEHCQVEDLIALIASMLDRLIEHNDRIPLTPNSLTRFHSRAPPSIGVRDYLLRIARYTNVEPCCLLILLPYVDKVCARMNTFTISSLTVHRFIIAAVSVGSKALSDAFCTNGRYSRVGGVSVVEMNLLEKEFCEAIDWRLTTSGSVLAHYYTSLVRSHPKYRLSAAPLPEQNPAPEPTNSASSTSSSSQAETSASLEFTTTANGSTPHPESTSTSPSVSSSSRSISNSASSSSMSIDPSPAPSITSLPLRPPSEATSSPHLPLKSKIASRPPLSSDSSPNGTSTPPLIPPNLSRRIVTASNLPSPTTGPSALPPRFSTASSIPSSSSTPHSNQDCPNAMQGIERDSTTQTSMMPPPSSPYTQQHQAHYQQQQQQVPGQHLPVKRGRRTSTSSDASSSSKNSSSPPPTSCSKGAVNGGGGGGGGGISNSSNPQTRFAPSPRLSAAAAGET